MAHVAIIESNLSGSGFRALRQAQEMGLDVTFVTRDPDYYKRAHHPDRKYLEQCERVLRLETNDPEQLASGLMQLHSEHPLDGIVTFGEYYLEATAYAARALGLPAAPPQAVRNARNKAVSRQLMKANHIPCPEFSVAESVDEALAAAERIGYPCVLKPVDRSSSTNVKLVSSPEHLIEHYYRIRESRRNGRGQMMSQQVLVEEYMIGPELSVETVAVQGQVHIVGITDKRVTGFPFFAETQHIFPAPLPPDAAARVHKVVTDALLTLGLTHGLCHTEVKLTAAGPKIVEVNARTGGDSIPDLVRLAVGVDLIAATFDLSVGKEPNLTPSKAQAAGIRFFTASRAGRFIMLAGREDALALPGVVELDLLTELGSAVRPPTSNNDRLAYAIVQGESHGEVRERLDQVEQRLRFYLE